MRAAVVVLLAALPALGGPAGGARHSGGAAPADARTLREADQALARAVEERDRAAVATRVAPDALLLDGGRAVEGPSALLERWSDYLEPAGPRLRWAPELAELSSSSDLGYTIGSYRVQPAGSGEGSAREGRYVTVWRREPDGVFRAAAGAPLLPPSVGGPKNLVRTPRTTLASRDGDLVVELGTWAAQPGATGEGSYLSIRRRTREGTLAAALETLVPASRHGG